ncbi:LADA_0F10814g1_1 [Lachancea dasiensis]|uniref:Dihydroorotate dehydrogenase (quinone), mitochondrial n=1 Tax=Lachancea dasiensis TaxID=1072105 RepID=A0A1G4JLW6_9SACH|nr:LADA_0F10814g1_1 [Lachancea dasiensis]
MLLVTCLFVYLSLFCSLWSSVNIMKKLTSEWYVQKPRIGIFHYRSSQIQLALVEMPSRVVLQGLLKKPNYFLRNSRYPLKSGFNGAKFILYTAGMIGGGFAGLYLINSRSAIHEYVLCPLVRFMTPDAENGHKLGIFLLKWGLTPKLLFDKDDEVLKVNVFGTTMSNPIGCAAGLDKNGEAIDGILQGGFAYHEIGSITPLPQPGNPRPRFFRLPRDGAVINRYGFNSDGHEHVFANVAARVSDYLYSYFSKNASIDKLSLYQNKLLAINLGKNKNGDEVKDYLKGVEKFQSLADVLVINVSSPNTPGLRDLQNESKLTDLLSQVVDKRNSLVCAGNALGATSHRPPILVKIAPDLTAPELQSIAEAAKKSKVDGIIVSNTTIKRPGTLITEDETLTHQVGGLSGKPLKEFSLKALRTIYQYTRDSDLVLVGCGGISSAEDALEFGRAGANFVQLYTAFAYKGPGLVAKIKDGVTEQLKKEGKTWMQIVGEDQK